MNELVKKGFLLGLGAAITSKEKAQNYLDDLVTKGQMTPKEAEDMFDSLIKKGEDKEQEWNEQSKEKMRSFLHDMNLPTKEEVDELKKRIATLEEKLPSSENEQKDHE
ncbi:phasin family protein [Texcoconibacillus texcoconensis]|uniref:Polyhydroxyalkanoate synthesis regulator phasin n=1 Tax=Texcoconibacillus texcoconensis TaxID=1095777 RepID=A0A840QPJ5_9BACI|nr:hypothetical protein [Texcoconibacillus texcoconensis]MBB5173290.1 polyhydroxyalkanoate synthesis regulator phasin [Texcoconibacillus texcoconensis]